MNVTIYCDGASRGNGKADAIGAYGTIIQFIDRNGKLHEKELTEAFKGVTNNQMELLGAIKGLEVLKVPCKVTLYSDSKYLCDAINKRWLEGWKTKGWINSSKQPVKNKELWEKLHSMLMVHNVEFIWVKGHASNEGNNRADKLCNISMNNFKI